MLKITPWIEAMRLRTLPVSAAGVIAASALAAGHGCMSVSIGLRCLIFAVLAQIASNFANEYYDYRAGLDHPGREGPRRGVTEGDISPNAMKAAMLLTLGGACGVGITLIGDHWWLLGAGAAIAVGAIAYSAGPYPLSRHALGEVAVIIFFGIVPVNLTFWLMGDYFTAGVACVSLAVGLMGANVLIINNYRDADDDKAVGKQTLATLWGCKAMRGLYLGNGIAAALLTLPAAGGWISARTAAVAAVWLIIHTAIWRQTGRRTGSRLNPLLGMTAMNMLLYSLLLVWAMI